ncbi:MAG TPA: hypothetical protein VK436_09895 [Methanocella sp.]|nr:hypothetical protein [Methanocella sp.]
MAIDNQEQAIRLIMYLATQSDYVTVHDILSDKLSGFTSGEDIKSALKSICDELDVKIEEGRMSLYRLPATFDGYKDVFSIVRESEQVYNFLSSRYSQATVNDAFVKEAVTRITRTPYFSSITSKYPENINPGEAMIMMIAQNPGFAAIAAMFSVSPAVASKLLYPETLSKYEITHLKICLDLTFAADMVKRVPPGTMLSIKYEILSQGMINMEIRGGTGVP